MKPHLLLDAPELARGRYPAPGWLILVVGGLVVAFAVAFLVVRFRPKDKR